MKPVKRHHIDFSSIVYRPKVSAEERPVEKEKAEEIHKFFGDHPNLEGGLLRLRQERIDRLNDLRSKMAFIQDNEDRKAVMDEIIALEVKLGYKKKLKEVV